MYREFIRRVEEFKDRINRKDRIEVVAVCKGVTVEKILRVYEEGCRDFGETVFRRRKRK